MRPLSSSRLDRSPVRIIEEPVRLSVGAVVLGWVARRVWRLVVAVLRSPLASITLTVTIIGLWVWHHYGPLPVVVAVGLLGVGLVGWRLRWPGSFELRVRVTVRSCWRGVVYRLRWSTAMHTAGLSMARNQTEYLPILLRVHCTRSVDRVRLRMLPGQTTDDFAKVADRLAQTFGTLDCRVRTVPRRLHELELQLLVHDPLVHLVPPLAQESDPLVLGLPVAVAEDGLVWRLQLLYTHLLVVGATGAGKGSVIWSILVALTQPIVAGVVKVWAIDPKGGMELALGRHLFDRFCYGDDATDSTSYEMAFAVMLEDAVQVMKARQNRLRGVTRLHVPTVTEPMILIVVDEIAALTAWTLDREAKRRINAALNLLLSQGRAAAVCVVGAVQDPRKEVLTVRDLFPTRIALRLNEAEQVNLVLGPGARNRGALCDQIPDTLPGVGYVSVEGVTEPVRVRFSYIDDHHITQLGHTTPEPMQLIALPSLSTGEDVAA